ncbi:hypothetical protein VB566_06170 [Clostridium perfringens]|uniref:hypothetical protein n=1 Tax=Clostridium perfringens TaxID=1502 RepID=UPI001CCECC40|nr:hypothetical protein [Clostridium perfringens]MDH5097599.1 hypothetical protein [Clostridium perfringens]MDM0704149.1 hypothetical protein [Clostridium perfringens]MEA5270188.1 hypothetical protein [Clostridium perfringens]MEA5310475.1 hypothetical protein [Clostridium perfringens]MEA5340683.1 hypothetical protein [Clostridium perfringens]
MGIFTRFDLFKKRDRVEAFPYDKAIEIYNELLNDSNYYSNEYYRALDENNEQLTKHYEKELEKVSTKIERVEKLFPWLPTEINRHL